MWLSGKAEPVLGHRARRGPSGEAESSLRRSGGAEPSLRGLGEAEPSPQPSDEAEPSPSHRGRRSWPTGIGRGVTKLLSFG